ncbi:MAG: response regulator transcription factor [Rhodospirillales bacterium]|nr:response regulator transcription factor [Rhodospirillales bacterium]
MNADGVAAGTARRETPPAEAPHILVVDDDDRLRALLGRYLRDHGYHVSTASSAAEARATLDGMAFDLIVLDVMMPGESGIEFTRGLRRSAMVPILLLTAMGEPEDRIAGLESGADDYLTKPFEPRELLLRVATILRRTAAPPPATATTCIKIGEFRYFPARDQLLRGDEPVRLTTAEADLLRIFAANPGETLSRHALSERLGGSTSRRAIDVQIARLRRKIEPEPQNPRHLQTVWGRGYVLRAD